MWSFKLMGPEGQGNSETQGREPKHEVAAILVLDTCARLDGLSPSLWGHHPLGRRKHRVQKDSQEAEEVEGDPWLTSAEYTQTISEGPDATRNWRLMEINCILERRMSWSDEWTRECSCQVPLNMIKEKLVHIININKSIANCVLESLATSNPEQESPSEAWHWLSSWVRQD